MGLSKQIMVNYNNSQWGRSEVVIIYPEQMEPNYVPQGSTLSYLSWSGVSLVLETNPMDGVDDWK
jgi:hypothetical protein